MSTQRKDKIQFRCKGTAKKPSHYYVLLSSNGKVMATSETYSSDKAAVKAVENFAKKHSDFAVDLSQYTG